MKRDATKRQGSVGEESGVAHDINPECVERTATAVAEGNKLAFDLERKIQEMRRERELQLAELNKALALLTQNVLVLSEATQHNTDDIGELREIAVASRASLNILMDERDNERERVKQAHKPWVELLFGLLEKAAWVAVGVIGLSLTEFIRSYLSKGG